MDIFGISLPSLKKDDFLAFLTKTQSSLCVFTPNPEMLLRAKDDREFQDILSKADYLTSDGIGLYIAFQILDSKLPILFNIFSLPYYFFNLFFRRKYLYKRYSERICGSDITRYLLSFAQNNNKEIAVIDLYSPGDRKKIETQNSFLQKMQHIYPGLNIHFFVWSPEKAAEYLETIKSSQISFLFSTLGMKTQEKSILDIMQVCPQIKVGLGVGSSFDTMIGFQPNVPSLWKQAGFEWLYRLLFGRNKMRRLKRLYSAIFVFIFEVYREKSKRGKREK